jgi:hypothetical protein
VGAHHDDEFAAWLEHAVDLFLGLPDLGHMVQDAVAEHHVEGVVPERQVQNAALPQIVEGEIPQC